MGIVTMSMSGYEIGRDDTMEPRYGDEVLCAGWVPALSMHQSLPERSPIPVQLAAVDVEAFLRKMYACQR